MAIKHRIEQFVRRQGRRPRILVASPGRSNHDRDTKLLAAILAQAGFDVDISPLHLTPQGTARTASENDVHAICFLSTEDQHKTMVADLVEELDAEDFKNVKILLGGTIPRSDYQALKAAGVDLIFRLESANRFDLDDILDLFEK